MRANWDANLRYIGAERTAEARRPAERPTDRPFDSTVSSPAASSWRQIVRDRSIERIDLRFTNMFGHWRSFVSRISDLGQYDTAGGFLGHAIPWSRDLPMLDPLVVPDFGAAFFDPFARRRTLVVICNVHDSDGCPSSAHDCRSVAQRIESFIQSTHIGGSPSFAIEIAGVRAVRSRADRSSNESEFRGGRGELAAFARDESDNPSDLSRCAPAALVGALACAGVEMENQQAFADGKPVRLTISADSVCSAADKLMFCRYVIDRLGRSNRIQSCSTEPESASDDIHIRVRQSVWRNGRPLFAGDGYGGTSAIMRHYAAGLVAHSPALVEVMGTPESARPRTAATKVSLAESGGPSDEFIASDHVSLSLRDPEAMSVIFSCPGVPPNPYLALAAMVLAGIDGFNYRMYDVDPFQPLDEFFKRRTSKPNASSDDAGLEFLEAGDLFPREVLSAARRR